MIFHGIMMPQDGVEMLKDYNSIYFGSAGDPDVPDHVTLWGLRLKICQGLDQYANLRPVKLLPGISSPLKDIENKDIDWSFIRENSEGELEETGGGQWATYQVTIQYKVEVHNAHTFYRQFGGDVIPASTMEARLREALQSNSVEQDIFSDLVELV